MTVVCDADHPDEGWCCTLPRGHFDDHVAEGVDGVVHATWSDDTCGDRYDRGFVCTRKAEHSGEHIAKNSSGKVVASWPHEHVWLEGPGDDEVYCVCGAVEDVAPAHAPTPWPLSAKTPMVSGAGGF